MYFRSSRLGKLASARSGPFLEKGVIKKHFLWFHIRCFCEQGLGQMGSLSNSVLFIVMWLFLEVAAWSEDGVDVGLRLYTAHPCYSSEKTP